MKTNTIVEIKKILTDLKNVKETAYESHREILQRKYGTCWLKDVASNEELSLLEKLKESKDKINDVYDDFINNDW